MSLFAMLRKTSPDAIIDSVKRIVPPALGDDLLSLTLHGEHLETQPLGKLDSLPIQILIVTRTLNQDLLARLAKAMSAIAHRKRLAPMILSAAELQAAADVFPITFLEVQRRHRLIAGQNMLAELRVSRAHLRLRCEQELRNLLIRMQSAYLLQDGNSRELWTLLKTDYRHYLRGLRAALMLFGEAAPDADEQTISRACVHFQLDKEILNHIAGMSTRAARPSVDELLAAFAEFLAIVRLTADAVDALPVDEVTVIELDEA